MKKRNASTPTSLQWVLVPPSKDNNLAKIPLKNGNPSNNNQSSNQMLTLLDFGTPDLKRVQKINHQKKKAIRHQVLIWVSPSKWIM